MAPHLLEARAAENMDGNNKCTDVKVKRWGDKHLTGFLLFYVKNKAFHQ